jgi:hypothetical protein
MISPRVVHICSPYSVELNVSLNKSCGGICYSSLMVSSFAVIM